MPTRTKKGKSLRQVIVSIIKAARHPLSVATIVERVEKSDYVTNAKDLTNYVRVTLSTADEFESVDRGVYGLADDFVAA